MKNIVGIVALSFLLYTSSFAGPGPEKTIAVSPLYKISKTQTEIPDNAPGMHKVKVGRGMTIGGSVLLVSGIALAATADAYYYNTTTTNGQTTESGDLKGGVGVILIAAGVGLTVPGVIIWSKGAKRLKQYKEENNLTFDIRGTSGVLTYRF
jgi:hypothetical protein